MTAEVAVLQAAVLGPAAAGLVWLALARITWARRLGGGVVALGAHLAGWWVLWTTYRGAGPAWEGLEPSLLTATVVVAGQVGIFLAVTRAESRGPSEVPAAVVGVAVSTSAMVVVAWSTGLAALALALPVPTVAAILAGLSTQDRPDVRGHLTLAAADAVALVGLSIVLHRSGNLVASAAAGTGPALVVAAGLVKAGVIPGVGTWRLVSADGAAGPLAAVLRAQGVVLAAIGLLLGGAGEAPWLAVSAGAAMAAGGVAGLVARRPATAVAALAGVGLGVPFVALGLGGAVGTRAFLVSFPAALIAAGAVTALAEAAPPVRWRGPSADPEERRPVRWAVGAVGLGVAVASLAAVPGGGGFPGAWLALSLGAGRGVALDGAVAGVAAVGLALALLGAVPMLRWSRARPAAAVLGVPAALALLYIGLQPVRLGIGWWVRIEQALGAAVVLPSAGAPELPVLSGSHLAAVLAPALVVGVAVAALGRGLRDPSPGFVPLRGLPRHRTTGGWAARRARSVVAWGSRLALGFGVALALEAAAVVMAIRLLLLAAQRGFL